MNLQKKGTMLVLATALISGASVYLNKIGIKGVDPYFYTYIKNIVSGIALVGIIVLAKNRKEIFSLSKDEKIKLLLIAFIGGSIPFLFFFKGLSMTAALKANFIHKTLFIYVGLLASIFLKEKINKAVLFGMLSMVVGSFLFLKVKPQALNIGDLYVFLAALFWAVEIVISKSVLKNISGNLVAGARLFGGSFFVLLFLLFTGRSELFGTMNFEIVKWGLISGAMLAAYNITFYNGLKYIKAVEATAILTLAVPITGILSVVFLHTGFSTQEMLGTGLIVLGAVFFPSVSSELKKIKSVLNRKKVNELS